MQIRDFQPDDAEVVNALALSAFAQYKAQYIDWDVFSQNIQRMSLLSGIGEIILAEEDDEICGAVAYIGPHRPKADFFDPRWPIIRMLVVNPNNRGKGAGRSLTNACVERAKRDKSSVIALHTSPMMEVALNMYLRMGFAWAREAPALHGVPYDVYIKNLGSDF
ncbi:GNAT family N-acetyltransferase [Janthinobacterium sp. 17J80-10]|uniref:GNAT family N-acetyltransferase n=1 Tax=Janthinobacterium sp. 17J80-10 TaxID=2497863 RepID=UPI001005448A|nr:GNAT family N-acetyltransferase [Janthinobacterium sp. 17J80-10]QAU35688.1 GNAT family N-acetyltransferase [Janthinobacterium sp. 17J80-10]